MARLLAMTLDLRPTRRDQPKITPVEESRGGAGSRVERARAGARKAGAGGRERGQKVSERGPKGSGGGGKCASSGAKVSERGPKGSRGGSTKSGARAESKRGRKKRERGPGAKSGGGRKARTGAGKRGTRGKRAGAESERRGRVGLEVGCSVGLQQPCLRGSRTGPDGPRDRRPSRLDGPLSKPAESAGEAA